MTLLWLSIGWVFASAIVAMLPMRHQYVPGVILLAFISMFRNPLRYFWARARGQRPTLPI